MVRNKRLNILLEKIGVTLDNYACHFLMRKSKHFVGRAPYGEEELNLIRQSLSSQNLFSVEGKMVPAFEKEFSSIYGVPYAVASTSGTAAIHVALGALNLNPGDEVITAPVTDMGTVAPILLQNAIPVFADIDSTFNMDPIVVEKKITSRTRAIIIVHLFGNACDMDSMVSIAKRHGIPLIEDCAQAHMTEYKGKMLGTIGDIGCFSFMQSKHMTTGEGGMTITSNKAYYERMKLFVDKGYARKGWGSRAYLFLAPNYRPSELVGAVGIAQLRKVKEVVRKRNELGEYMSALLSKINGITPAPVTDGCKHSYWLYPFSVHESVDVTMLAKALAKEKVWVTAGYTGKPIYLCTEALRSKRTYGDSNCPFPCRFTTGVYDYVEGLCPRSEELLKRLICLPFDESWSKLEVERVAMLIEKNLGSFSQRSVEAPNVTAIKVTVPVQASASQQKKIRIGIIGCGQMGRWHLDAFKTNPNVQLIAFADTVFDRAQEFAKEANAMAYSSHTEMIEREKLDGVSVCTLPSTHKSIALDLLDAGVNVLCEKPLAISVDEAQQMVEAANRKNLLLLTAFKFRFFKEVVKGKELIESGSLGKILNFRLMFAGFLNMAGTWQSQRQLSGGGVIIDNACHAIDLVRYLFGEINSVFAEMRTYQDIQVEDTAKLSLSTQNGACGTIDLSWDVAVPPKTYLEVYGEEGTLLLDLEGLTYKFKTWDQWKRVPSQDSLKDSFALQTNHFVRSILEKKSSILKNEDGLKAQIAIEAAYYAAKTGRNVIL